ncbi:hypothetical protein AVEN_8808-1 [Araneus ventricosus]|uniref:Uncharacterized protein n=1 Tax=Araneus ventricosus TaxID=182803 RepID=A0A4Y2SNV0_ARAVE|nr:hypothetical protein AVEN_8808-1 [Araneus ventricosus]
MKWLSSRVYQNWRTRPSAFEPNGVLVNSPVSVYIKQITSNQLSLVRKASTVSKLSKCIQALSFSIKPYTVFIAIASSFKSSERKIIFSSVPSSSQHSELRNKGFEGYVGRVILARKEALALSTVEKFRSQRWGCRARPSTGVEILACGPHRHLTLPQ